MARHSQRGPDYTAVYTNRPVTVSAGSSPVMPTRVQREAAVWGYSGGASWRYDNTHRAPAGYVARRVVLGHPVSEAQFLQQLWPELAVRP